MAGNANSGKAKQKVIRDALLLALNDDAEAPMRSKMDRVIRAHVTKALEGDMAAIKEIYDRIDGKPAQAIVGGSEEDGPGLFDPLINLMAQINNKSRSV